MPRTVTAAGDLVRIEFERTAPNGLVFRDAIVLSQDQYNSLTPEQIELMEQERYDAWWAIVNPPPFPPEGFDYYRDESGEVVRNDQGVPYLVLVSITDPLPEPPVGYTYERDEQGNLVLNILGQPILAPVQQVEGE